jgi:hypothetical protein
MGIQMRKKHKVDVLVHDLSKRGGGFLSGHQSHRTGRDVDVGLFERGRGTPRFFKVLKAHQLDAVKTFDMIQAAIVTGCVTSILLDSELQRVLAKEAYRRGFSKRDAAGLFRWVHRRLPPAERAGVLPIVKTYPGHANHAHIRVGDRCSSALAARAFPSVYRRVAKRRRIPNTFRSAAPQPQGIGRYLRSNRRLSNAVARMNAQQQRIKGDRRYEF